MKRKIAVVFPGIGYHADKPLLYYGARLARAQGYEIRSVRYPALPGGIREDAAKRAEAVRLVCGAAEAQLGGVDWAAYGGVLFLSKSIGTAAAARLAAEHGLAPRQVYFTPLAETFDALTGGGIVFHGTADPWAETAVIRRACAAHGLPLHETEGANHSLETGDVLRDLDILRTVMTRTAEYLAAAR